MDIRAFGKGFEEFYDRVREEGAVYRRANPAEVLRRNGRLVVRAEDTILGEFVEVEADMVVLAVGLQPRPETKQLAEMLKLELTPDGFFKELHHKMRPVETGQPAVFLAGCAQGPKDIPDTVAQAKAAASSAMIVMRKVELLAASLLQVRG
jgi:heterodisulfide reductase subunit A